MRQRLKVVVDNVVLNESLRMKNILSHLKHVDLINNSLLARNYMKECRITIPLAKPIKFGLFFPEGLFNCKCLLEISLAVISRANNSLEKPCC